MLKRFVHDEHFFARIESPPSLSSLCTPISALTCTTLLILTNLFIPLIQQIGKEDNNELGVQSADGGNAGDEGREDVLRPPRIGRVLPTAVCVVVVAVVLLCRCCCHDVDVGARVAFGSVRLLLFLLFFVLVMALFFLLSAGFGRSRNFKLPKVNYQNETVTNELQYCSYIQ